LVTPFVNLCKPLNQGLFREPGATRCVYARSALMALDVAENFKAEKHENRGEVQTKPDKTTTLHAVISRKCRL